MSVSLGQEFQWKVMGIEAPILFAEFTGRVRDVRGNVIGELSQEHFEIVDAETGTFRLSSIPETEATACRVEIYGQLPSTNRILIFKGALADG